MANAETPYKPQSAPTSGVGALGNRFIHRFDISGVWQLDQVMNLQMWIVTDQKLTFEPVTSDALPVSATRPRLNVPLLREMRKSMQPKQVAQTSLKTAGIN